MADFGPNPMLIEDGDPQQAPLILIHDGSGLIFHYFSLPEFGRPVYGLYDPYFFSEKQWGGGLSELAEHDWALIRQEVPPGQIVLGGWSLGGIIALEMSVSLARCAPEFTVTGIMMLDSVNPTILFQNGDDNSSSTTARTAIPYTPKYEAHTSRATREYISNAIGRTERLLESWNPPEWLSEARPPGPSPINPSSQGVATLKTPPVVLLRATQYVPLDSNTNENTTKTDDRHDRADSPRSFSSGSDTSISDGTTRLRAHPDFHSHSHLRRIEQQQQPIATIDIARDRQMLGWEDVDRNFAEAVLDIPGHHYSIFAAENIDGLSHQMRRALNIFDLAGSALSKSATKSLRRQG